MSDTAPTRRLTVKGRATRDRIVAAAATLIASHGVAGTSIEAVRRAAEVSSSQLYHYFDSKQELVSAVITRQADAAVDAAPDLGTLDSLEALRAWADAAVARQAAESGSAECDLGMLAGELSGTDEASRRELATGLLRWQGVLADGLGAMRSRGELRPDADPDELSLALLTVLQGGRLMTQTLRDTRAVSAAMTAVLAHIASFTDR